MLLLPIFSIFVLQMFYEITALGKALKNAC